MAKKAAGSYVIESLDAGISVMLMFLDKQDLSITQVADHLGMSRSTAHRILHTLEVRGLVSRSPSGRGYFAGPVFAEIAKPPGLDLATRRWIAPVLDEAAKRTGATIHASVLLGSQVLLFDGRLPEGKDPRLLKVGLARPAYVASCGKMLLSRLTQEQVTAMFTDEMLARNPAYESRARLLEQLEEISQRGFAINLSEKYTNCVAVMLTGQTWRDGISIQATLPKTKDPDAFLKGIALDLKLAGELLDTSVNPGNSAA